MSQASEPIEAVFTWNSGHWPSAVPSKVLNAPAISICQAAATKLFTGSRACRERMLPTVQAKAPASNTPMAMRRVRSPAKPVRSEGHTSAARPAKPSAMPSQPRVGRGSPPGRSISASAT